MFLILHHSANDVYSGLSHEPAGIFNQYQPTAMSLMVDYANINLPTCCGGELLPGVRKLLMQT